MATAAAPPGVSARRLLDLIAAARGQRVVVLGDLIADEFVSGRISRVSREAPVLILEYDKTEIVPGGAGNAAHNVATLGGAVTLVALAGRDEPGRRVLASFPPRVDRRAIVRPAGYHTPVKTRILAGGVHSAKQQVVRVDRFTREPMTEAWRAQWMRAARAALRQADAVLVSDYGSGLVSPQVVTALVAPLAARQVPVLVDSRYDLMRYRGLTACTPNESEVEHALDVTIGDAPRALERAGRAILKKTRMDAVLVTRGSRGMALFEHGTPTTHIPIYGSDEIADVTGAGDTVMATLTLALAAGASMADAARLANYAGGLVVMKRGTATVSARELANAVTRDLGGR
jgi:D-glycero-beta-D-manno-heptose-7-phosphate kinase